MKFLACGGLVPGCAATFRAETEDEILTQAARHAAEAHCIAITPELQAAVKAQVRDETAEDTTAP